MKTLAIIAALVIAAPVQAQAFRIKVNGENVGTAQKVEGSDLATVTNYRAGDPSTSKAIPPQNGKYNPVVITTNDPGTIRALTEYAHSETTLREYGKLTIVAVGPNGAPLKSWLLTDAFVTRQEGKSAEGGVIFSVTYRTLAVQ